jgi:hypothetical protein
MKMLFASITSLTLDITFWTYFVYVFRYGNRKWFQMTSNPIVAFTRMAFLCFSPELFTSLFATQSNYSFYKHNKQFLESQLTVE